MLAPKSNLLRTRQHSRILLGLVSLLTLPLLQANGQLDHDYSTETIEVYADQQGSGLTDRSSFAEVNTTTTRIVNGVAFPPSTSGQFLFDQDVSASVSGVTADGSVTIERSLERISGSLLFETTVSNPSSPGLSNQGGHTFVGLYDFSATSNGTLTFSGSSMGSFAYAGSPFGGSSGVGSLSLSGRGISWIVAANRHGTTPFFWSSEVLAGDSFQLRIDMPYSAYAGYHASQGVPVNGTAALTESLLFDLTFAPIPEPATTTALSGLLAAAGVIVARRRKKNS